MTNKQPEALRLAELLELAPEDGIEPQTTEDAAAKLRRLHSENETLRVERERNLNSIRVCNEIINKKNAELESLRTGYAAARAPADSVTASSWASHEKELEDALRERDESDEFIDTLLDEVLGADRAEWSSAYGRSDALNDVQERMTTLHKPTVDKAWGRFQVAMAADSVLEDAARWQTFIALPYATRAEWASNLSLAPVLTQWVDTARKQGENHD